MPATNRLLLDANMTIFRYNPAFGFPPPDGITNLIPVTEQSSALACTNANPALRHPGCTAENAATLRWAPDANYTYRGARAVGLRGRRDQQLQRGRVVRHRFAQHQGRLPAVLAASARRDDRGREPARLPLQPGRAEPGHLPAADVEPQHDHAAARRLRPGPVHPRPPDAVGRASAGIGRAATRRSRATACR